MSSELPQPPDFKLMQEEIIKKMDRLDNLTSNYHSHQEKKFIATFANVIDKIGTDLVYAQEAYRNIDVSVLQEEHLIQFAEQIKFFREECFFLRDENYSIKSALATAKEQSQASEREKVMLEINYARKVKECMRLAQYNKKLQARLNLTANTNPERYTDLHEKNAELMRNTINCIRTRQLLTKEEIKSRVKNIGEPEKAKSRTYFSLPKTQARIQDITARPLLP